jgi:hypothetical protein
VRISRSGFMRIAAGRLRKQLKEPHPECHLPEEMLQNEIGRAEERATAFEFMREYTAELEVYLLGKADLEFAEPLPEERDDCILLRVSPVRTAMSPRADGPTFSVARYAFWPTNVRLAAHRVRSLRR